MIYFVEELTDHATDRREEFVDPDSRARHVERTGRASRPSREPADCLLHQIQRDILDFKRRETPRQDFGDRYAGDQSLRVLGCPNPCRELEVITDEIWALKRGEREGFEAGELEFNDIAVIINHRRREQYPR